MARKFSLILVFIITGAIGMNLFAAEESDLYVKTVMIDKVYSHELGYRVIYLRSDMSRGETFIPNKWMRDENKTLSVKFGYGPSYPYMTIWWKDGKFNRVKMYLVQNFGHYSWGTIREADDYTEQFNIDTLTIDF